MVGPPVKNLAKKPFISPRRQGRTKQPSGAPFKRTLTEGPLEGLSLEKRKDHPIWPSKWILSYGSLVLGVFKAGDKDGVETLWDSLVERHRSHNRKRFEPRDPAQIERLQSAFYESLKSMEFWDRVWRLGRAHHSHPDLDIRARPTEVPLHMQQASRKANRALKKLGKKQ